MSNSKIQDILDILDYLGLDETRKRLTELYKSPEFSSYNSLQLLREILSVQYISDKNSSFEKSVKLSKVRNISASLENIKTGNGRKYDENVIEQISSFDFVDKAYNVGIYGVSGAGKTYLMSALCIEACREGFDCRFIDYGEMMDEPFLDQAYVESCGQYFMSDVSDITLGDDEYYCLGDNRPASSDSRYYGPFKKENIRSKGVLILWPFADFGLHTW